MPRRASRPLGSAEVVDLHPAWTCPVCRIRFSHPCDEVVGNEAGAHMERLHQWDAQPKERHPLGDYMVRYPSLDDETVDQLLDAIVEAHKGTVDLWVGTMDATFSPWVDGDAWTRTVDAVISTVVPGLPRRWYHYNGWQWQPLDVSPDAKQPPDR